MASCRLLPMQTNQLQPRSWVPPEQESFVQSIAGSLHGLGEAAIFQRLQDLVTLNSRIDNTCINLNPAGAAFSVRAVGSRCHLPTWPET